MTLGPAVLDQHVAALDKADFAQSLAKSREAICAPFGRTGIENPNWWYRRLLRTRRERPRRRAAESSDEIAPSKKNAHLALPCEPVDQVGDRGSTGDRTSGGRPSLARRRPRSGSQGGPAITVREEELADRLMHLEHVRP